MAISRYSVDNIINFGRQFGTATGMQRIRDALNAGALSFAPAVLRGGERLDTVAGEVYGDATLWWVIAAASDIGWGMQVPAGTFIRIPSPEDVAEIFV